MSDQQQDPIEVAAYDIVRKVVEQVGGDLDRVNAIADAQVIAGRALKRLALVAQTETLTLDHLTLVGVVSDVARAERGGQDDQEEEEGAAA